MSGRKSIWIPAGSSRKYHITEISPRATHVELILDPTSSKRKREPNPSSSSGNRSEVTTDPRLSRLIDTFDKLEEKRKIQKWAKARSFLEAREVLLKGLLDEDERAQEFLAELLRGRQVKHKDTVTNRWYTVLDPYDDDYDDENDDDVVSGQMVQWENNWRASHLRQLNQKQRKCLSELEAIRHKLAASADTRATGSEDWKKYDKIIRKAIQNGLDDHPRCVEWVIMKRIFGDRKSLHTLFRADRKGGGVRLMSLEKGVSKPIHGTDRRLLKQIDELESKRGMSLRAIYQLFYRQGKYTKTWQSFHKWLSRQWPTDKDRIGSPFSVIVPKD